MNQNHQDAHKRCQAFCKYLSPVCPVLAFVIAVTVFAAMLGDFDSTIGHFERGSVTWILSVTAACAAVLLSSAVSVYAQKSASLRKDPEENIVTVFASVLTGVLGLVCMITYAADYAKGMLSKFDVVFTVLVPFVGIALVLGMIGKTRFSSLHKAAAILAAAAVNVSLFADYFDFVLPLNSPVRNTVTVVKAAVLLYLLSEARFAFGAASGRLNLAATVFAAGLTASVSLGYSAGMLLGRLFSEASASCPPAAELALLAAVGIHAAGRMFALIPAIGAYVPPADEKKKKNSEQNTENTKIQH